MTAKSNVVPASGVKEVKEFLNAAVCADCPSTERWANEMLVEQQMVAEAKRLELPIESYVARKADLANQKITQKSFSDYKRASQSFPVELIEQMPFSPPSRIAVWWYRLRNYSKAKIPHMLFIRPSKEDVAARRNMCVHGFLMCGSCGELAPWDSESESFYCKACDKKHLNQEQRKIGQACPFVEHKAGGLFCKACGCGHRRDANLAVKTTMKFAKCPKGLWPGEVKIIEDPDVTLSRPAQRVAV